MCFATCRLTFGAEPQPCTPPQPRELIRLGTYPAPTGLCLDRPGLSPFSGIAGTQHTIAVDEVTGRCDVRYTQRHSTNTGGTR